MIFGSLSVLDCTRLHCYYFFEETRLSVERRGLELPAEYSILCGVLHYSTVVLYILYCI